MKNQIFAVTLLCLCMVSNAQKVDLNKENYSYSYRSLPNVVLDNTFQTYSVTVDKTVTPDFYFGDNAIKKINIEGRKNVNGGAHLNVKIWMGKLNFITSVVDRREYNLIKDKNGNVIGGSTYFRVQIVYTFETLVTVNDLYANTLKSYKMVNKTNKGYFNSNVNAIVNEPTEYNNTEMTEIKTQLIAEQVDNILSILNTDLNYDFGYPVVNLNRNFWILNSKKHIEYAAFNGAVADAKAEIEAISSDSIPSGISEKIMPSIEYFEGLLTRFAIADDKEQMKLRYAAYYNLAYIYYSTENFDRAIDMCNLLIHNGYNIIDGEKLIEEIINVKALLQKNSMTTQHFSPAY